MSAGSVIRVEVQDPKNDSIAPYHRWMLSQGFLYNSKEDTWLVERLEQHFEEPIKTRYYEHIIAREEFGAWLTEIKKALRAFGHDAGVIYKSHIRLGSLEPTGEIIRMGPNGEESYKAEAQTLQEVSQNALDDIVRRV